MNIDKSYLNRIIKSHEKSGYIIRKASATDLRSFELYLTLQGESAVKEFIRKSNQEIAEIIKSLDCKECTELITAYDVITKILEKCDEN